MTIEETFSGVDLQIICDNCASHKHERGWEVLGPFVRFLFTSDQHDVTVQSG